MLEEFVSMKNGNYTSDDKETASFNVKETEDTTIRHRGYSYLLLHSKDIALLHSKLAKDVDNGADMFLIRAALLPKSDFLFIKLFFAFKIKLGYIL